MFTSFDCLKIDTLDYLEKYKANFTSLINQKRKDRSDKIDQIMSSVKDGKFFKIYGDDDFKEGVYKDIMRLLEVKPGRILFKELFKFVEIFKKPITINGGDHSFRHADSLIEIPFNDRVDSNYNSLAALEMGVSSKPRAITLAHELIHELHAKENAMQQSLLSFQKRGRPIPEILKDFERYPDPEYKGSSLEGCEISIIFKNLSSLEEEHTILGINIPRFIKN